MKQYNFNWPDFLHCSNFPADTDLCVGLREESEGTEFSVVSVEAGAGGGAGITSVYGAKSGRSGKSYVGASPGDETGGNAIQSFQGWCSECISCYSYLSFFSSTSN